MNIVETQHEADQHYQSRFSEIGRLIRLREECYGHSHNEWSEAITERLDEMPLSVTCRAIFPQDETCHFEILLGTGGPADRVLVVTDLKGEVDSAVYQYQDWFTAWTEANGQDRELVRLFAENFYFWPPNEDPCFFGTGWPGR